MYLSELFTGIPNYQLELTWSETDEVFTSQINIVDYSIQKATNDFSLVTGSVTNIGAAMVATGVVIGTFYDEAGTVVAAALGLADVASLAPGESAAFTLVVEPPTNVVIASYVLQPGAA